jgi:hypothetical protein
MQRPERYQPAPGKTSRRAAAIDAGNSDAALSYRFRGQLSSLVGDTVAEYRLLTIGRIEVALNAEGSARGHPQLPALAGRVAGRAERGAGCGRQRGLRRTNRTLINHKCRIFQAASRVRDG